MLGGERDDGAVLVAEVLAGHRIVGVREPLTNAGGEDAPAELEEHGASK